MAKRERKPRAPKPPKPPKLYADTERQCVKCGAVTAQGEPCTTCGYPDL